VQAYLSTITQLKNHEYCYSGVSIVLGLQTPSLSLFI